MTTPGSLNSGSVHRITGTSNEARLTGGPNERLRLAANDVGDGAIAAEAAVLTGNADVSPTPAVYRPGVDDADVHQARWRPNARGGPRLGNQRVWPPPSTGQALRLHRLSGEIAQLRREYREISGRDLAFASASGNITPQQAIRRQESTARAYREAIQRHYEQHPQCRPGDPYGHLGRPAVPRDLRTASRRIDGLSRQPGNSSITGRFTQNEMMRLAERFVGQGYTTQSYPGGPTIMRSSDGLREVRLPAFKSSTHPTTLQPFSSTGYVANFQTYRNPPGLTRGAPYSNVHVDVVAPGGLRL